MEYTIGKKYKFEAAHQVRSQVRSPCLCHNIHGHSYTVEVILSSDKLDESDMVVDYGYLDDVVKPIIEKLDHSFLYADLDFTEFLEKCIVNDYRTTRIPGKSPTAENIAMYLLTEISSKLQKLPNSNNYTRLKIIVKETEKSFASVEKILK